MQVCLRQTAARAFANAPDPRVRVRRRVLLIAFSVSYLLTFALAAAQPAPPAGFGPLENCVPADAMAVYFGRPSPEMLNAPEGGTAASLASWLITLKGMGLIPKDGRVVADVVGTIPMLWRRPHCAMLLDITTREIDKDVYRLDRMQAALVVASAGMELALERRIRDLLATYTDAENGTIETQMLGNLKYHRLVDGRLPDWAVTEWGQVGEHFVAGFGAGAFAKVATVIRSGKGSLAEDRWFAGAHAKARGATCGIEIYADVRRIRERLERDAKDRPTAVLQSLHLEIADKLVWTTGHDERAIRSVVVGRDLEGKDYFFILAGRENASPEVAAQIPGEADSYLVLRMPMSQVFRDSRHAYMESQSPGQRRAVRELWNRLQAEYGFDSESEVIDQLGDHLLIHTFPAHPLRLPVLCTIWIQIAGDESKVAHAVDRMMTAWQDSLTRIDPVTTLPTYRKPAFALSPQVRREPDGLWSLHLGFINPAMTVTKGWLIISWSPEAVRNNLHHLGTEPAATAPVR